MAGALHGAGGGAEDTEDAPGGGGGDDGPGLQLSDAELLMRAQLVGLLEAHCWAHDAEGRQAPPGARVSGGGGRWRAGLGDAAAEGAIELEESSPDEDEEDQDQGEDEGEEQGGWAAAPGDGWGGAGPAGGAVARGKWLPGTGAPWRRDSLPAGALGRRRLVAPRRLVVVGTAAARDAVDASLLAPGLLQLDAPVDAPAVADRGSVLRQALLRARAVVGIPSQPALAGAAGGGSADGAEPQFSHVFDPADDAEPLPRALRGFAEGLIGYVPRDTVALVRAAVALWRADEAGREAAALAGEEDISSSLLSALADLDTALTARDDAGEATATAVDQATPAASGDAVRAGPPAAARPDQTPVLTLGLLERALRDVPASALSGLQTSALPATWDDVGGLEDVKQQLIERLQWPVEHREVYEAAGVGPPPGVLLFGPPGCSKTLLVRALATTTRASFFALSGADVYSRYVGEAERNLREAFRRARAARPAVIFLDEIDALVGSRGAVSAESDGGASAGVLATLLTEMDGIDSTPGVVVVAATNKPEDLDAALLRPGRLELRLPVGPPNRAGRLSILQVHTRALRLGEDVSLDELADRCARFTGAEVEALCRLAATRAERAARLSARDGPAAGAAGAAAAIDQTADARPVVGHSHFESAMQSVSTLFGGPLGASKLRAELARLAAFSSGAGMARAGAASMLGTKELDEAAAAALRTAGEAQTQAVGAAASAAADPFGAALDAMCSPPDRAADDMSKAAAAFSFAAGPQ
ncbi:hypothetical protein FNF31_05829 [Cafeteria roenbergensis]|uniref:AAA+ ATPase domain-containing protein n=2 Tax=Cafeteria roenbergensis TaxID=33653 RepID=A0A5A8CUZ6_CAFRO|nr:hypothetical protein FNF31_05829 [Cafeteria roenbergensis]